MIRKFFLMWAFVAGMNATWAFDVVLPKVEYTFEPLGIDVAQPRFSWQMSTERQGARQMAYRIVVIDEDEQQVWDSGRVASDNSVGIRYDGDSLKSCMRYRWTVEVWDDAKEHSSVSSWFETAFLDHIVFDDTKDENPQWIGGDERAMPFCSQYLPVFRLSGNILLDKKSKSRRAALIYGANDRRLMDANKNILGVANGKDESYIKVELEIGDSNFVNIYREGYTPHDRADKPVYRLSIPSGLLSLKNRYVYHHIAVESASGTTDVFFDGEKIGQVELNPLGKGGDFIAFPVVGDIGFSVPQGQKARFMRVEVKNYRVPQEVLYDTTAVYVNGKTIIYTPREHGAVVLRTFFNTDFSSKSIRKARLYASARGIYDILINGNKVGIDYLNPGLTQYNKTMMYQTYDVTGMVREGENQFYATLNEGWWSGNITYDPSNWNLFGCRQALWAKLVITYDDGTTQEINTNPATWEYADDGPIRYGSLFQGEVYDARRVASHWERAEIVPLPLTKTLDDKSFPTPSDWSQNKMVAQVGNPVRPFSTLKAQTMTEPREGVYVYDMGQNMAGVPRLTFSSLHEGQQVTMRFAEVLYPDLPSYQGKEGMMMMENIRAAMAQDIYIAKGNAVEIYQPISTYHGYRYVEITGLDNPLPLDAVEGVVLSSVDSFTTDITFDSPLLSRFFENVKWSTLANVFSIPTDCPQRNERMGWSGDLSVFSPAMSYLFNANQFLRRHLLALRDTQGDDGAFADIAPIGGGFGGPLWQSVGIVVLWQMYVQYGDTVALREHYPAMKRYVKKVFRDYINPIDNHYQATDTWKDLGDWLGFENAKNDNTMIFDCYLAYELGLMEKMAKALGEDDDATYYYNMRTKRVDFINTHYFQPTDGKTRGGGFGKGKPSRTAGYVGSRDRETVIDTQTSYAVPLGLDVLKDYYKKRVADNLVNTVRRENVGDDGKLYPPYSLMTGFVGTPWICFALSDNGYSEMAWQMLLNSQYPSWLYPVTQGATTIWERLNSMTKKDGFGKNNRMNSFNHYAFGSVVNWILQRGLGIAQDEESPAFKHFYLRPEALRDTSSMRSLSGCYESMYGKIESSWQVNGENVEYRFTIPANTSATVILPAKSYKKVKVNNRRLKKKQVRQRKVKVVFELTAGKYTLTVANR
ncbi:MAG: family 78 glycoside hydrolase catalytic domain [Prevotella sp.]|nr:family 78 glycoside hydrolase catalytic domain [Prevotella sp.]